MRMSNTALGNSRKNVTWNVWLQCDAMISPPFPRSVKYQNLEFHKQLDIRHTYITRALYVVDFK